MPLVSDQIEMFLIAGGIGLLIGLERERIASARAGVRTSGLVSILGALTAMLGQEFQSVAPFVTGLAALPPIWLIQTRRTPARPRSLPCCCAIASAPPPPSVLPSSP